MIRTLTLIGVALGLLTATAQAETVVTHTYRHHHPAVVMPHHQVVKKVIIDRR